MLRLFKKRKIKEVGSWDGSASNYSTPQAFAQASLINFNTGSPDTWTKGLIKLPVRNEGDSKDTYIKQAVQAAAGGRGITRVKKPSSVSQDVFNSKMRSAANEIIKAYGQWGGTAPDSVYKVAGRAAPKQRSVAFDRMYEEVFDLVQLADQAEDKLTILYDIYFEEETQRFYALGSRNGLVYKIEVFPEDEGVTIGEFVEITSRDLTSAKENKFRVYRGMGNQMRWLAIASVAVLNRVGQIDSTELFDSFIDFANTTGHFPVLNVYHLGDGSEVGKADLLARKGFVYIASGIFYDNPYGRAAFKTLSESDEWGDSIEFWSPSPEIENFNIDGMAVQIPVYKNGINTGITILKEKHAASVFTLHKSKGGIG